MKLKDIPAASAYLVFHDAYANGEMDVYLMVSLESATETAKRKQTFLENSGMDDCGFWRAYKTLPRKKVHVVFNERGIKI